MDDHRFRLLHALRLKGLADHDALTALLGEDHTDDLDQQLSKAVEEGLVKQRTGRMQGWTLTREGRDAHQALLAEDRERPGLSDGVRAAYDRFLPVNQPFIDLCTHWQVRSDTGEVNDHEDQAYDQAVIGRLVEIDGTAQEVAKVLDETADRFASYRPRLANARAKVVDGEREWFTKPTIDSYHTIWFELHEDLLLTLGIERGEEEH